MTAASTYPLGLDNAPTHHPRLLAWVREVAELTTPERVVWVDGSEAEWQRQDARAHQQRRPHLVQPAQLELLKRGAWHDDALLRPRRERGRVARGQKSDAEGDATVGLLQQVSFDRSLVLA